MKIENAIKILEDFKLLEYPVIREAIETIVGSYENEKEKIKEKIEEKIEEIDNDGYWLFDESRDQDMCKEILQSLLEEEE